MLLLKAFLNSLDLSALLIKKNGVENKIQVRILTIKSRLPPPPEKKDKKLLINLKVD